MVLLKFHPRGECGGLDLTSIQSTTWLLFVWKAENGSDVMEKETDEQDLMEGECN